MVSEKNIFFCFSYYKSMGANDPRGVGTTKRCYILNIQALGLVVSEKKFFSSYFTIYNKPMVDNDAPGHGQFGPQGHGWQD